MGVKPTVTVWSLTPGGQCKIVTKPGQVLFLRILTLIAWPKSAMPFLFLLIGAIVVIKMKANIVIALAASILTACTSTEDSRYKDTHNLETPPEVVIEKPMAEQQKVNELDAPKHRRHKGLGTDVYKDESSGQALKIKRSFDESWSLLGHAIQQNDIRVPDHDRSKGVYYVIYNGSGFLTDAVSFFKDNKSQATYLLKVEPTGDETSVVVSLASKDEQTDADRKNVDKLDEDNSAKLVNLLYETLHDDVKDE
jgi:hypothetical protein